ncbi:hypothetical protein [Microbispora sp. NPDC049125]
MIPDPMAVHPLPVHNRVVFLETLVGAPARVAPEHGLDKPL